MNNIEDIEGENKVALKQSRRPWWRRWLKVIAWTAVIVITAFLTVCGAVVWFLTPERLTPIIEKVASAKLDADVKIGRAELTFWSSFPNLKVEVTDLNMVSRSLSQLDAATRASLPANADSLLSVRHFSGGLNLLKVVGGEIALNDVVIDCPRINLLQVNDTVSNFNIFPPSDPNKPSSPIPNITLHHFMISNAEPITYRSMADSISFAVELNTINVDGSRLPEYELTLRTDVDTPMLRDYSLEKLRVGVDGDVRWDGENPKKVAIDNLKIVMDGVDVEIDTSIDFNDELRLDKFDMKVNKLEIDKLRHHLPGALRQQFGAMSTDMTVNIDVRLLEPLVVSDSITFPKLMANVNIPPCYVDFHDMHFKSLELDVTATTGGDGLNSTKLDIGKIVIDGKAMDLKVDGSVEKIFSDPTFEGHFVADIDFNRMPAQIRRMIPGRLNGRLSADTRVKVSGSDMSRENFHRVYADGQIRLRDLLYESADTNLRVYARSTNMNFGSRRTVNAAAGVKVDSMLVVKIGVDTMSMREGEHNVDMRGFNGAFASTNRKASVDTTRINPFGGSIGFEKMDYHSSHDSVFMTLTGAKGLASFRQYKGDTRVPQIGVDVAIDRARISSKDFRSMMRNSRLDMTAHLRRRGNSRNRSRAADGRSDRDERSTQRALTAAQLDSVGAETIDFDVDNSLRDILMKWNATGHLTSQRGNLRFKGMPLRSRMSNLDASFTSDSIAVNAVDVTLGRSDFHLAGSISNLRGAMNRRRPQPLRADLSIVSDTIHVNQLVQAAAAGHGEDDLLVDSDEGREWDDEEIDKFDRDIHADTVVGAVLVPVNLDAGLHVKAKNVLYSDMNLEDFHGDVLINRGVLQLHDIAARNSAGSVRLSALYSAPTKNDMSLGIGMLLEKIDLSRLSGLVPAINKVLPIIESFSGIVTAKVAATVDLFPDMDMNMNSLRAAISFEGDSLQVEDNKAMRTAAKWLMFKNKKITRIDSIDVNMTVRDGQVQLYPFMVTVDRYKLGIMGHSDLMQNLDYHVAVLKSPIPFKFGINIKGSAEKPKIRFGGAKLKPDMIARRDAIADTVRVNLVREINSVFRRGLKAARLGPLDIKADTLPSIPEPADPVITASDSLMLIEAGLIEAPADVEVDK